MTEDTRDSEDDILLSESEVSRNSSMMLEDTAPGPEEMSSETLIIPWFNFERLLSYPHYFPTRNFHLHTEVPLAVLLQ